MRAAILFSIFMLCNIWAKGQVIKDKCILECKRIVDLNLELPSKSQRDLFDPFRITHMLPIDMIKCEDLQTPGKPTNCSIVLQADTLRSIHMAYEHVNTDSLFMVIEKTIGHYAQKISFGIEGDPDSGVGGSTYAWNLAIGKVIVTTKETEGSSTLLYNFILTKSPAR